MAGFAPSGKSRHCFIPAPIHYAEFLAFYSILRRFRSDFPDLVVKISVLRREILRCRMRFNEIVLYLRKMMNAVWRS